MCYHQDGNTPLHASACNKPAKAGVIQALLQHGAHFDLVNNDKRTFFNLLKGTPLHEVSPQSPLPLAPCSDGSPVSDHQLRGPLEPGVPGGQGGAAPRPRHGRPARHPPVIRDPTLVSHVPRDTRHVTRDTPWCWSLHFTREILPVQDCARPVTRQH